MQSGTLTRLYGWYSRTHQQKSIWYIGTQIGLRESFPKVAKKRGCEMETHKLLSKLKYNRKHLTGQQMRTIKGQILAGDLVGAEKGLQKLLNRQQQLCRKCE